MAATILLDKQTQKILDQFLPPPPTSSDWSTFPAVQNVDMAVFNLENTNIVKTQTLEMDGTVNPPAWKATAGNDTYLNRISGDFAGSMRISEDLNNPLAPNGFLLDSDVNVPTLNLTGGNVLELKAKDPTTDPTGAVQKILSSVNLGGANFFKGAQQQKSVQQNAPSGSVDITFDTAQPWSDVTAITQTSATDFTVNTAGIYQLEFSITQLANGQTWATTANRGATIDITRAPTAEQVILGNNAVMASGVNQVMSTAGTLQLQVGDVINCRSANTLTSVGNGLIQCVQNTFDYNTTFTWSLLNASSTSTPAVASFSSTAPQTVTGANTPTTIAHNTTDYNSGGYSLSGGNIVVSSAGVQQVDVSVQLDKTGGGTSQCDIWFRINGTNVPNSASQIVVAGTNGETVLTVPQLFVQTAGSTISVVFASSDASMTAAAFPAQAVPQVRPAIPSIITRIQRVG